MVEAEGLMCCTDYGAGRVWYIFVHGKWERLSDYEARQKPLRAV